MLELSTTSFPVLNFQEVLAFEKHQRGAESFMQNIASWSHKITLIVKGMHNRFLKKKENHCNIFHVTWALGWYAWESAHTYILGESH